MKKHFLLVFVLFLIFFLIGCTKPVANITSGQLTRQEDRTTVSLVINIESGIMDHWELYPGIDSTLLDNKGNEYKVLKLEPDSNISGVIDESGVYTGTLIFPRLDPDVTFLRLRIDNVKHFTASYNEFTGYSDKLNDVYAITYNFEIDKDTKKISYIDVEKEGETVAVKRETYNLKRVSVEITDKKNNTIKIDSIR